MSALADEELSAWLALLGTPGVGRETARRLLAAFGSPQAVRSAPDAALRGLVGPVLAAALAEPPPGHVKLLQATQAWRRADLRRRVLVLGDADYPPALLHTADPPLLLYLEGRADLLSAPSVAVVGSRRPTAQGREHARQFAEALARQGWVVVSGLAAGIDGAAHEGALRAGPQGAGTVAIMGTGIDTVYPASHAGLARRIVDQGGLLVSELPLGAPPLAAHFPQRNRIIAGLGRGTLVVEAALRSGSLITARLAAEAGREVMVLPGSILSDQSAGCHELIRQGATLVSSVDQAVEALGPLAAAAGLSAPAAATGEPARPAAEDAEADDVLRALGHDPTSLDALMARCGWPAAQLQAHLLTLELQGRVARLPGGLFQRLEAG